jgi:hypothetical protein
MLPEAASLATPDGSGAAGAACETPDTDARAKATIATAKTIRTMLSSLRANECPPRTQYENMIAVPRHRNFLHHMNKQSASISAKLSRHEQTVRLTMSRMRGVIA